MRRLLPTPAGPQHETDDWLARAQRDRERSFQLSSFQIAADHGRCVSRRKTFRVGHPQQSNGGNRLGLALGRDRRDRLDVDGSPDEPPGAEAHEDLAGASRLLEARRRIHRVAGDHGLALAGITGHDLAGEQTGTGGQGNSALRQELDVQDAKRGAHLGRRSDGPQGIVFMDCGKPEDGHDCVADELLDGAMVAFDGGLHRGEVLGEHGSQGLRIERLAELGRSDDVTEQDRDHPARTASPGRRLVQRRPALHAEPGAIRVLSGAGTTGEHGTLLGRCRVYGAGESRCVAHPTALLPAPRPYGIAGKPSSAPNRNPACPQSTGFLCHHE